MAPVADVAVCTPVYRAHAAPNLTTLAASLPAALGALEGELVVALNGITAAEARVPATARAVDLGVNRGVAPGWNAAARAASAEVVCFANDDVVLGPRALEVLVRALRDRPDAGIVGPVGTRWDVAAGEHRAHVDLTGRAEGDVAPCEVVSGFLFACRRETWEAVGGFDEAYAPLSWEEVDFCTAVRARGLRCLAVAGVGYEHEWGISAPQRPWRRIRWDHRTELLWAVHRRNRRRFLRKWAAAPPTTL
jgi:GT2 family glycosyltransferase